MGSEHRAPFQIDSAVTAVLTRAIIEARGREICGFFVLDSAYRQQFIAVPNRSLLPAHSFSVCNSDRDRVFRGAVRTNSQIMAFVHSHRISLDLSVADQRSFACQDIPWAIVVLRSTMKLEACIYHSLQPSQATPLPPFPGVEPTRRAT
jgi:proteasome lid subunit RPN8/RPN11